MILADLEARLAAWHAAKYPNGVNVPRTLAKLHEELAELMEAWSCNDGDRIAEEAADVVIVLFHLVRFYHQDFPAAIEWKLGVIEERLTNPEAGR